RALRGHRAQVVHALLVIHRAEEGLHQAVEHPRLGEVAPVAAVRAGDLGEARRGPAVLLFERLLELVGTEPPVARAALAERVHERIDMSGSDPDLPVEDHRAVQPHNVVALLDHRAPPLAADVLLQLHPQRAVVPGRPGAPVDLTGGVDEAPTLGEVDDRVDSVYGHGGPPARRSGIGYDQGTGAPAGGARGYRPTRWSVEVFADLQPAGLRIRHQREALGRSAAVSVDDLRWQVQPVGLHVQVVQAAQLVVGDQRRLGDPVGELRQRLRLLVGVAVQLVGAAPVLRRQRVQVVPDRPLRLLVQGGDHGHQQPAEGHSTDPAAHHQYRRGHAQAEPPARGAPLDRDRGERWLHPRTGRDRHGLAGLVHDCSGSGARSLAIVVTCPPGSAWASTSYAPGSSRAYANNGMA